MTAEPRLGKGGPPLLEVRDLRVAFQRRGEPADRWPSTG